jgi:hypothetical protein
LLNLSGALLYMMYLLLENGPSILVPIVLATEVGTIGYYFASIAYEIQKAIKRHEMGDSDNLKISASLLMCIFGIYFNISALILLIRIV